MPDREGIRHDLPTHSLSTHTPSHSPPLRPRPQMEVPRFRAPRPDGTSSQPCSSAVAQGTLSGSSHLAVGPAERPPRRSPRISHFFSTIASLGLDPRFLISTKSSSFPPREFHNLPCFQRIFPTFSSLSLYPLLLYPVSCPYTYICPTRLPPWLASHLHRPLKLSSFRDTQN